MMSAVSKLWTLTFSCEEILRVGNKREGVMPRLDPDTKKPCSRYNLFGEVSLIVRFMKIRNARIVRAKLLFLSFAR